MAPSSFLAALASRQRLRRRSFLLILGGRLRRQRLLPTGHRSQARRLVQLAQFILHVLQHTLRR
eukprot:11159261-Lingulodinium_polyedra.AAC.1